VLDDRHDLSLWQRWRASVDLDSASSASHELLPSAVRLLELANGDPDPDLGRLRGLYRHRWVLRQRHIAAAERAMRDLDAAGVPYMAPVDQDVMDLVPEPLVLALRRPRLIVPDARLRASLDALLDSGWRPAEGAGVGSMRRRLVQTEWTLAAAESTIVLGIDLDAGVRDQRYRNEVWARAVPSDGSARCRPAPIDLFVAMLWDAAFDDGAWRWAIGALAIARRHDRFDEAASVWEVPGFARLLPVAVSRLAFLVDVDPQCPSLVGALTVARDAQRRLAPTQHAVGPLVRQWRHRTRQAGALAAAIRRHGGLAGTVAYARNGERYGRAGSVSPPDRRPNR
jgi:hypothetical protein